MSLRARLAFVLFASLGAAAAAEGCFSPTQITVTLTTDVPCGEHVETAVFVGQDAVSAETADGARASETRCVGGNIGTVALVPSGARDANVALRVVTAIRGERADVCAKAPADRVPAGCIVARRRLGFVRNAPLSLPVVMRATCAGVACPTDQTCVGGSCRFSQLRPGDCERPEGCAEDTLPPSGPAPIADAGTEGGAPTDAGTDAPTVDASCPGCDVTQIAAAASHACALRGNGTVWCWGGGLDGVNGILGSTDATRPYGPIAVENVTAAQGLACGGRTCAVITPNGALGWGDNSFGQITGVPNAAQIRGATPLPLVPFSKLAFGAQHVLGMADVDKVHCFADNSLGQCDNNADSGLGPHDPATVLLSGVNAVSAGARHSCALTQGRVLCWGGNDQGQTGAGSGTTVAPGTPVPPAFAQPAVGVRAGQSLSCASLMNGDAYCWGGGERGGDAGAAGAEVPIQVEGAANIAEIALLASTACLRDTNGDVRCFGVAGGGEIGDGTTLPPVRPRLAGRVLLPGRALAITAGASSACAIVENQGVYCWGQNNSGQLGTGRRDVLPHATPIRVDLPPP